MCLCLEGTSVRCHVAGKGASLRSKKPEVGGPLDVKQKSGGNVAAGPWVFCATQVCMDRAAGLRGGGFSDALARRAGRDRQHWRRNAIV